MVKKPRFLLREIVTFCPICKNETRGIIYERDNRLYIKGCCSVHSDFENQYFENSQLYFHLKNDYNFASFSNRKDSDGIFKFRSQNDIMTIHINFTEKCQLSCPICFADVCKKKVMNEPKIDEIITRLKPFDNRNKKPMIVIVGGEPTLRDDLFELIHTLREKGFNTRLSTNGLKLIDEDYVYQLKKAGLEWVLLQFDGFNSATSKILRGVDLVDVKLKVIENCQKYKIKIHLVCMICPDENDKEIIDIINYAFKAPNVYAINFYPSSVVGRCNFKENNLENILKKIEQLTSGTITQADYFKLNKILYKMWKILRISIFKPKVCTLRSFIFQFNERIYLISEIFKASFFFAHPITCLLIFYHAIKSLNWPWMPNKKRLLYFNIETFWGENCMYLEDLLNCHNAFLTEKGLIPFCLYNSLYRDYF